mmetsp:Transcript_105873/g.337185  ORF Transcript_105873/g.337185 Transcript_105873/m.337185 type:complete len:251 (+) Transcript_105873:268-1020(+)
MITTRTGCPRARSSGRAPRARSFIIGFAASTSGRSGRPAVDSLLPSSWRRAGTLTCMAVDAVTRRRIAVVAVAATAATAASGTGTAGTATATTAETAEIDAAAILLGAERHPRQNIAPRGQLRAPASSQSRLQRRRTSRSTCSGPWMPLRPPLQRAALQAVSYSSRRSSRCSSSSNSSSREGSSRRCSSRWTPSPSRFPRCSSLRTRCRTFSPGRQRLCSRELQRSRRPRHSRPSRRRLQFPRRTRRSTT